MERLFIFFPERNVHVEVEHVKGVLQLVDLVVESGELADGS